MSNDIRDIITTRFMFCLQNVFVGLKEYYDNLYYFITFFTKYAYLNMKV